MLYGWLIGKKQITHLLANFFIAYKKRNSREKLASARMVICEFYLWKWGGWRIEAGLTIEMAQKFIMCYRLCNEQKPISLLQADEIIIDSELRTGNI